MTVSQILAGLLIALTPIHAWALVIVIRARARFPKTHALRSQFWRLLLTALGAGGLAVIAGSFLLGRPLPRGAGFAILVGVLLSISGPPVVFILDYYRPRGRA